MLTQNAHGALLRSDQQTIVVSFAGMAFSGVEPGFPVSTEAARCKIEGYPTTRHAPRGNEYRRAVGLKLLEDRMKLFEAAFLVAMAPVISAGQDFAGRWDITVSDQGQTRAWWLELGPAGSGQGSFVGAPDGSLDPVHDLTVKDAELHFTVQ